MIVTFSILTVCIPRVGRMEGGRGGSSRLFQSICLAIPLQWTVFTAWAAKGLWEMITGGVVSISNSKVLFPHFQSFCNFESEAEVRLLSVHFLLLCVCVCARFFRGGMLSFLNVKGKSDTFHGVLHFGHFCSNFFTH